MLGGVFGYILSVVPSFILDASLSGIDSSRCTPAMVQDPGGYRDCFAWMSSAVVGQVIPKATGSAITVAPGFGVAAKVSMLGMWFAGKFQLNVAPGFQSLYVYMEAGPVNLFGMFRISRSKSDATRGPLFLIDVAQTPPSALVQVAGYMGSDPLGLYGEVQLIIGAAGFDLQADLKVFNKWEAHAHVWWNWDVANLVAGFKFELASPNLIQTFIDGLKIMLEGVIMVREIFSEKMSAEKRKIDNKFNNFDETCKVLQPKILNKLTSGAIQGAKKATLFFFDACKVLLDLIFEGLEELIKVVMKGLTAINFFEITRLMFKASLDGGSFSRATVGIGISFRFFTYTVSGEFVVNLDDLLGFIWEQGKKAYNALKNLPETLKNFFKDEAARIIQNFMDNLGKEICKAIDVCGALNAAGEWVGGAASDVEDFGDDILKGRNPFG